MTKDDIIRAISTKSPDLTLNKAREIYETTIKVIKDRLSKGEKIELRGFGTFMVREKKQRTGRNPRTLKEAVIKERRVVTFSPSKKFKNKVN